MSAWLTACMHLLPEGSPAQTASSYQVPLSFHKDHLGQLSSVCGGDSIGGAAHLINGCIGCTLSVQ